MSNKDSFLQLIGLADADPEISGLKSVDEESSSTLSEDTLHDAELSFLEKKEEKDFSVTDPERTEYEPLEAQPSEEYSTFEELSESEAEEVQAVASNEDSEKTSFEPEELYAHSDDEVALMNSTTHRQDDESPAEIQIDESSRTGIMTQEDRLLEGLEDAEYSRATDIFTAKTKAQEGEISDLRRTAAILGALEQMEEPIEGAAALEEVLAEASQPTKSLYYEEEELQAGGASEILNEEMDVSTDSSEGSEISQISNDQETSASSKSSLSGYQTVVGLESEENSERQTMAFQYQKETENYGRLFVREGETQLKELILQEFPVRLGRDPSNDLILEDINSSRFHCEIQDRGGRVWIQDLGSTNGLKINGAIIRGREIRANDLIQIGETLIEYLPPGAKSDEAKTFRGAIAEKSRTHKMLSQVQRFRKNKRLMIAASLFVAMGLLYGASQIGVDSLKEAGTQAVAENLKSEVETLKELAEQQVTSTGSIYALNPEEVKAQAIAQAKENALLSSFSDRLESVPADYFLLFVAEPDLVESFIATGGDQNVLLAGIQSQMNRSIQTNDQVGIEKLYGLWKAVNPNDPELENIEARIQRKTQFVETPEIQELSQEERDLFLQFMKEYKDNYEELLKAEQYSTAMTLSEDVIDRILKVVRQYPYYADFAEPYIADWKSKISQAKSLHSEVKEERDRFRENLSEGRAIIREAQDLMDEGKIREANLRIDEFLASFEDHPDRALALDYRNQIRDVIQQTFSAMKREVETFVKTDNFALAWEKLYYFMDQVPNFDRVQEVKQLLHSASYNRARQYYNQARVFEFEADDLLSAEQYYKRTLETADPRGDLAARANRRYEEVLRKKVQ